MSQLITYYVYYHDAPSTKVKVQTGEMTFDKLRTYLNHLYQRQVFRIATIDGNTIYQWPYKKEHRR